MLATNMHVFNAINGQDAPIGETDMTALLEMWHATHTIATLFAGVVIGVVIDGEITRRSFKREAGE